MITEKGLNKNQIIQELTRSPHGKLEEYVPNGARAQRDESEFFAHLISWNAARGQIRDAKLALPVIALSQGKTHDEFAENALAHLCSLDPRNLLRAFHFSLDLKTPSYRRAITRAIERYLRAREANKSWWTKTAVQHRHTLKDLYCLCHVKPSNYADAILFLGAKPKGSIFEAIAQLKNMSPREAAGTILEMKIPFLIATAALGKKASDPDLVLALIAMMSPTELVTNAKRLEKLGIKTNPALRSAFEEGLRRVTSSGKNMLKTTVAAEAVEDESTRAKLRGVQEKQLQKAAGIEGNWLVLGDKSASMQLCIETSRHVASTLAKMVRGKVHLVFFDTHPRPIDATGKTYDELLRETRHVEARNGTSVGCGLMWALENDVEVDGIAIISDAQENNAPQFAKVYQTYSQKYGREVPVYLYRVAPATRSVYDHDMGEHCTSEFDLRGGVDYYSLPNLVQTMRTNRYSLVDEIMEMPLLTLREVFE